MSVPYAVIRNIVDPTLHSSCQCKGPFILHVIYRALRHVNTCSVNIWTWIMITLRIARQITRSMNWPLVHCELSSTINKQGMMKKLLFSWPLNMHRSTPNLLCIMYDIIIYPCSRVNCTWVFLLPSVKFLETLVYEFYKT